MRSLLPGDLQDCALLVVGALLGYWVLANKVMHGSTVPGTTLLGSNSGGQSGLG